MSLVDIKIDAVLQKKNKYDIQKESMFRRQIYMNLEVTLSIICNAASLSISKEAAKTLI